MSGTDGEPPRTYEIAAVAGVSGIVRSRRGGREARTLRLELTGPGHDRRDRRGYAYIVSTDLESTGK